MSYSKFPDRQSIASSSTASWNPSEPGITVEAFAPKTAFKNVEPKEEEEDDEDIFQVNISVSDQPSRPGVVGKAVTGGVPFLQDVRSKDEDAILHNGVLSNSSNHFTELEAATQVVVPNMESSARRRNSPSNLMEQSPKRVSIVKPAASTTTQDETNGEEGGNYKTTISVHPKEPLSKDEVSDTQGEFGEENVGKVSANAFRMDNPEVDEDGDFKAVVSVDPQNIKETIKVSPSTGGQNGAEESSEKESKEGLTQEEIDEVMAKVKENGRSFVEQLVEKLVAMSEALIMPTSKQHLIDAELKIFEEIYAEHEIMDIEVDVENDNPVIIHTVCFERKQKSKPEMMPLVLVHGLGGGLPCFHLNYIALCQERKVYGIDLPGFALSTRVAFPKTPDECQDKMVTLIDKWREAMNIDKFILLGHSFGGYLSAAYTLKHHNHVRHLILTDPWGLVPKDDDCTRKDPKLWEKAAMAISNMLKSNPFDAVRGAGPLGPILSNSFLPEDVKNSYGEECTSYFYHALAQSPATGETVFSVLSDYEYIWPINAMKYQLAELTPSVPITFIFGEKSPFYNSCAVNTKVQRDNIFVLDPVSGAGHHVQAQEAGVFNKKMKEILSSVDRNTDKCVKETI